MDAFITKVDNLIINPLITFLFALAVAFFLYGVFEFIWNQDNEEKKTSGKSHMIWGVIGITIMMAVWAILGLILSTFQIPSSQINVNNGNIQVHLPPSP